MKFCYWLCHPRNVCCMFVLTGVDDVWKIADKQKQLKLDKKITFRDRLQISLLTLSEFQRII